MKITKIQHLCSPQGVILKIKCDSNYLDCEEGLIPRRIQTCSESPNYIKYQGVKEFHMLACVGCCNIMVFSPFKVKVTYYHPLNLWLLGATSGNQGQTVMCLQCSETIKICLKRQIPYYHPLNLWLLGATNGNQGQTVMHL